MLHSIYDSYPIVFDSPGRNKARAREYTEFKKKWGFIDIFYQMCNEDITKTREIYQFYLSDFMQYLSYSIERQYAEEKDEKYQDNLRKARKGR